LEFHILCTKQDEIWRERDDLPRQTVKSRGWKQYRR